MREAGRHDGRVGLEHRVAQAFLLRRPGCGEICLVGPWGDRDSAWIVCPRRTAPVRREAWLPDWSAEIDGCPTASRSADGLFQAVTVPAGPQDITFSFVPPGVTWALLGLLAGVALVLMPTARSAASSRVQR